MLTLCIMPNFKGTRKEAITACIICLLMDSIYVIPIVNHYL